MHTHEGLGREAGLRCRLRQKRARGCGLLVGLLLILAVPGSGHGAEPVIAYTPNPLMTTPFGPASADILLRPANFLPCLGGPIALCYYSGPEPTDASQPDLSCVVTEDGQFANCRCVEIPVGPYYVDINSILDVGLYQKTVKKCGKDGADCREQPNKAPVCQAINDNTLFAREGAQTISTFSFALNSSQGFRISSLNCDTALYAGCMTAPCVQSGDAVEICDDEGESCSSYPVDVCACPTFDGPYQVGKAGAACDIGASDPGSNVWSAAYNPLQGDTAPRPGCFPDAPGDRGCPLLAAIPDSDPTEPVIPAVIKGPDTILFRKALFDSGRIHLFPGFLWSSALTMSEFDRQGLFDVLSESVVSGRQAGVDAVADAVDIRLVHGFPEQRPVGGRTRCVVLA